MDTSTILQNRIDFCGIIVAERCNPNGDPINGNVPRQDFNGHGIITDVCLKRKIRDRLLENGYDIFVVKQDALLDGQQSLHSKVKAEPGMVKAAKSKDRNAYRKIACEKWIDVRAFGQVFAFKASKASKGSEEFEDSEGGVSECVRGPVTIQDAVSLGYVTVAEKNLTKSVNLNDPKMTSTKSSDTMGVKYQIDHGAYVFRGSMYPQLAKITGFTYGDALAIKEAIINIFMNDASAARPAGSIALDRLYWWEHNCPNGQYSPAKVFRSLQLNPINEYPYYTANLNELPGLHAEILDGW